MPWLFINTFHGGINTDSARINRNQALKMENLDISKGGFMKKRQGYVDLARTDTPSNIKTIFEWSSANPDDQNLLAESTTSAESNVFRSTDGGGFSLIAPQQSRGMVGYRGLITDVTREPSKDELYPNWLSTMRTGTTEITVNVFDTSFANTIDTYNNWILVNLDQRKSALISDYDGREFYLDKAISGQGENDLFYIFKNSWDRVYSYQQKNSVMRGGVGISDEAMPFWNSYLEPVSTGLAAQSDEYHFFEQNIIRPGEGFESSVMLLHQVHLSTILTGGGDALAADTYHYKMSLLYDGAQETEMIQSYYSFVAGGSTVPQLNIFAFQILSPRITHAKIYRATDTSGPFSFIETISIDNGATDWAVATTLQKKFLYNDNVSAISLGDTYFDITGRPENSDNHYLYNYKYEVQIGERRFIAGTNEQIFDAKAASSPYWSRLSKTKQPNRVYWSHITPKLVICPDIFLPDNFMVFDEGGTDVITGLARVLKNLIVFLNNTTFVVRITSGNILTWEKVETISGIGCVAPRSIVDAQGNVIFAGRDNIYAFNLTAPTPLLDDRFEQDYQAISNKSSGVAVYYPKRRQYKITFSETETSINSTATMFITYVIDLKTGAVHKHQSLKDSLSYAIGIDGELFRTDGSAIYEDDNSSFTETIGIGYRSSMIDAGVPGDKNWKEILLHYQSDDDVKIRIYLRREDQGRGSVSPIQISFPAKPGSMTTKVLEINQRAEAIQLEVYSDNSTNSTVKIGQIGLNYEQLEGTAS